MPFENRSIDHLLSDRHTLEIVPETEIRTPQQMLQEQLRLSLREEYATGNYPHIRLSRLNKRRRLLEKEEPLKQIYLSLFVRGPIVHGNGRDFEVGEKEMAYFLHVDDATILQTTNDPRYKFRSVISPKIVAAAFEQGVNPHLVIANNEAYMKSVHNARYDVFSRQFLSAVDTLGYLVIDPRQN